LAQSIVWARAASEHRISLEAFPHNVAAMALYPALFVPAQRPAPAALRPLLVRSVRAVAFRLSVLGTATAALVILHHNHRAAQPDVSAARPFREPS
jgi:hypothetical protein